MRWGRLLPWCLGGAFLCAILLQRQVAITSEVAVTWSIREDVLADHTLTLGGNSFHISAGTSATQLYRLKGSRTDYLLYSHQGWGLLGQELRIDGREIPLRSLRVLNSSGHHVILGWHRQPTMRVEIDLSAHPQ